MLFCYPRIDGGVRSAGSSWCLLSELARGGSTLLYRGGSICLAGRGGVICVEGPDEVPTTATRPVAPTALKPVTYVDE